MRLRLLAAVLLLTMLGGCAGTPNPLRVPFDDPNAAYVVAGMQLDPTGNEWPRWAHFELYQVGGNESISLGFDRGESGKRVHAIAVKPGDYELRNVRIRLVGNKTIFARQPFAVRFQLEAGKAYSLGDYRFLCKDAAGMLGNRPVCALFRSSFDAALDAKVRQRYPQIDVIHKAQLVNLESAYPIISEDLPAMLQRLREAGALPSNEPVRAGQPGPEP